MVRRRARCRLSLHLVLMVFASLLLSPTPALAELVEPNDIATLRDVGGLSVSPDGAWIAFQVRRPDPATNQYNTAWYVLATNRSGPPHRIGDAGDPILWSEDGRGTGYVVTPSPVWSPGNAWISYLRSDRGRVQVWRSMRSGRRTEQLTHNESNVRAFAYSRDATRLLFEVEESAAQIHAALEREGRNGFLFGRRFFPAYSVAPTLPADVHFGSNQTTSNSLVADRRLWVLDVSTQRERLASPSEHAEFADLIAAPSPTNRQASFAAAAVSQSGALAWAEPINADSRGGLPVLTVLAKPADSETPFVCAIAECTSQFVRGVWWRTEEEVIFARGEGPLYEGTAIYAWRPRQSSLRLIFRTEHKMVGTPSEWSCAVAASELICFYEEQTQPRRLVALDLDRGTLRTIFDPNPDFAQMNLGSAPQHIIFRAEGGVETYGHLVLPPEPHPQTRLPLVIVTYRCAGFLRGGVGDEYPIYAFAAQGFAVLCFHTPTPIYQRLDEMSWDEYSAWSRGSGDPAKGMVQAALDSAIARLNAMGVIDPRRVGITGLSFGAETVHYAVFRMPHLTAAIASGAEIGPSSPFLYGPAGRDLLRSWGLESATSERWRDLSLGLNAQRARSPMLLNVADHEMINTLQTYTALEQANRAVEMYVFPEEYHIKWQPAHRLAIYNRNIDWMNFWLRGVESGLTEDATQYERWRAMRENQCRLFGPNGTERHVRPRGHEELTDEELTPWYCYPGALAQSSQ